MTIIQVTDQGVNFLREKTGMNAGQAVQLLSKLLSLCTNSSPDDPIRLRILGLRVLELESGLDLAVETIRVWHGIEFRHKRDEEETWKLYQASPEMKKINAARDGSRGEEAGSLLEAVRGLIQYRKQAGPLNLQLEKADDFIQRMENALEEMGEGRNDHD